MIYVFSKYCQLINIYKNQLDAAENLEVTQPTISKAINGKLQYVKDFIVFKAKNKPVEHFFEHCRKYQIPYYNTFYVVVNTIDNSPIWYATDITKLKEKLDLPREKILEYIVDSKIYNGKRILIQNNIMPEFDKLL